MKLKQAGVATLIITITLTVAAALIMIYAAQRGLLEQKLSGNQLQTNQAFQAAEAGLEFGIAYLNQNSITVLAGPSNGYINYGAADTNLTNVTLANGSKFSVVYTNPTQNNYRLLQVTSTGVGADGVSTRVVRQQVYAGVSSLKYAITSQQDLTAKGNVSVTGDYGANLGGTFSQNGSVTVSQVTQNDNGLANMSQDDFFQSIFGMTSTQLQAQSTYYANDKAINYSSLSGMVWINSDASISGNVTIGSPSNPVLLIVNGNFSGTGTANIYGLVFVTGTTTISGGFGIQGGLVSQGSITMTGTSSAYNANIVGQFTTKTYAKVPGSWRDF